MTITSSQSSAGAQNEPVVRTEPATAPETPSDGGPRPGAVSTAIVNEDVSDASSAGGTEAEATVPAPATAATPPEPQEASVAHYQGPNPYRATPAFDVAYDPAVWEFVEDDGSGRQGQLKHRSLPGCAIWLRAGPVDGTETATVWLAEQAWTISQVQSNAIQYTAPQDDVAWVFGVLLPEPYSGMGNSTCQDAAERVLDTFRVLP